MSLRTLKDIELKKLEKGLIYHPKQLVSKEQLKTLVIKWVKEDKELIKNNPLLKIEEDIANRFTNRWMKRLDITEEDLK